MPTSKSTGRGGEAVVLGGYSLSDSLRKSLMNRSNLNTGLEGSEASRGEQHVPERDIGLQDGRLGPWCSNRTAIAGGMLPGKKLHCISGKEETAVCWQHGGHGTKAVPASATWGERRQEGTKAVPASATGGERGWRERKPFRLPLHGGVTNVER